MSVFSKSQWIWIPEGEALDQYAEFRFSLPALPDGATLRLSCDTDYALWINGVFVSSNQYGDFEHYKVYDSLSIAPYLTEAQNRVDVLVHHDGAETSRYFPAAAGLIYEVESEGALIAYSDPHTLCRLSPTYQSGRCVFVSGQLGFTFFYDATQKNEAGFCPAMTVEKHCTFFARPTPLPRLLPRREAVSTTRLKNGNLLLDLGGEVVGVPTLSFYTDREQTVRVYWGEHILDGEVRRYNNHAYYYDYTAPAGQNDFTAYLLRLGCRYLEVESEAPITLAYASVLPQIHVDPPLRPVEIADAQARAIYDASVNTLRLCMIEHYVDTPHREQALYAFDSRNQMRFGYDAFSDKNAAYARANLLLFGMDRREDGILSITTPCGMPLAIPSFSLHYILAVWEYVQHTKDLSLAEAVYDKLCSLCHAFVCRMQDSLAVTFTAPKIWNFYDWSAFADSSLEHDEPYARPDLILNSLLILALDAQEHLSCALGRPFAYTGLAEQIRQRARAVFATKDSLYPMHPDTDEYTALGNTWAILSGIATPAQARVICRALADDSLPDCSLSMKFYLYTALLDTDTDAYREVVLAKIRRDYLPMIQAGSDTVWETAAGAQDFGGTGSLCHAWSAVPISIYHRLGIARVLD